MTRTLPLLTLTSLLCLTTAKAQWNVFDHPGYTSIYSITSGPGALYMVAYPNGVIKSTDGGNSWNPANNGLPAGTAVESVYYNNSVLLAGTHSGVYRSTDAGATWVLSNSGLPATNTSNFVNKFFHYGTATFAVYSGAVGANTGGVWRSTDNGQSWFSGNGGLQSNMTVYQIADINSRLWAATNNGLASTTNLAVSWNTDAASNFACYGVQGNASRMVVISSFGYRYRTHNIGNGSYGAWTNGTGAPANPTSGELILYDGKYWAITNQSPSTVLRSTDNGSTWSTYATGISGFDAITQYEFHASGTSLYLGTLMHLYSHTGTTLGAQDEASMNLPAPYPTVFNDRFMIDLSLAPAGSQVVLFDATGREVSRNGNLPNGPAQIERNGLPAGTYRVMLISSNGAQRSLLGAVVAQ
ncbi:MAG: hypothetical protein IPJ85_00230 [Flavobacteriales bacterium]|nr:hypothetical protein [Flavobacteriales bacterium]